MKRKENTSKRNQEGETAELQTEEAIKETTNCDAGKEIKSAKQKEHGEPISSLIYFHFSNPPPLNEPNNFSNCSSLYFGFLSKALLVVKKSSKDLVARLKSNVDLKYYAAVTPLYSLISCQCQTIVFSQTPIKLFLSEILDHKACILIVFYSQPSLDLYPGDLIHKFPFNYSQQLVLLKELLEGSSYVMECKDGPINYKYLSFCKINLDKPETIVQCIKNVFHQLQILKNLNEIEDKSLEIPYCKELLSLKPILEIILDKLSYQSTKFQRIVITTNDSHLYQSATKDLCDFLMETSAQKKYEVVHE